NIIYDGFLRVGGGYSAPNVGTAYVVANAGVHLGFAELFLSVAAPPATAGEALRVAAEHVAFCPHNVNGQPLDAYAAGLVDSPAWHFWWD
ncbi:DUF4253 domain-containing protein, partial [Dactylosporangium sp. NPDC049525]|uniref:DUF4253 domain-containing protein n=1 Tax=Dactylosporangium sp. NPDC049525 TaxID=3154730 RepID=UPI0034411097